MSSRFFVDEGENNTTSKAKGENVQQMSIGESRFFANDQAEDDVDQDLEDEEEERKLQAEQAKKAKKVSQHVKKMKEAAVKQKHKSQAEKHCELVSQAAKVILDAIEAKKDLNKLNTLFTAFKQSLEKYQKFFGEHSIKQCNELFQFLVDFDLKVKEFEENKTAKDKAGLKIIVGLKKKVTSELNSKYVSELEHFKTNGKFETAAVSEANEAPKEKTAKPSKKEKGTAKQPAKKVKSIINEEKEEDPANSSGEKQVSFAKNEVIVKSDRSLKTGAQIDFSNVDIFGDNDADKNNEIDGHKEDSSSEEEALFKTDADEEDDDEDNYSITIEAAVEDESLIDFRTYFLKKQTKGKKDSEEVKKETRAQRRVRVQKDSNVTQEQIAETQEKTLEELYFGQTEGISSKMVINKVEEFISMQGYKSFSLVKILNAFEDLLELSNTHKCSLTCFVLIKLNLINLLLSSRMISGLDALVVEDFDHILLRLKEVLNHIDDLPAGSRIDLDIPADEENLIDESKPIMISMSLIQMFSDLDIEFWSLLKSVRGNSPEYVQILRKSKQMIHLFMHVISYCEGSINSSARKLSTLKLKLMKHIYYLPAQLEKIVPASEMMPKLHNYIQNNSQSSTEKSRSLLYYIYFLAIRGKFGAAKHLMQVSCIYDDIDKKDIETQILYNHAITQLGISAFKNGQFEWAHQFLCEIQCTTRSKEMLGQDLHQTRDKPELRKLVDSRVEIPYHLSIPQITIEFCYLTSALFVEFWNSIFTGFSHKISCAEDLATTQLSRHLKFVLLKTERDYPLLGQPERISEHIYCLFRALLSYDHRQAFSILSSNVIRDKVYCHFDDENKLMETLNFELKKICLFSFLMQTKLIYSSLPMKHLEERFELSEVDVNQIIAKCIRENLLNGYVDRERSLLVYAKANEGEVVYHDEVNSLLKKMSNLVSNSERLTDTLSLHNIGSF